VFDWIRRMAGVSRRATPQELLGLAEKAVEGESSSAGRGDLYYLLEEEKIPRELWPWILAYVTRSSKLTYLDDKDIEYLRWKIMAHAARIQLEIDNILPPPDLFPSLDDYRKHVGSLRLLPVNLEKLMLFIVKRAYHGFERRLESTRTYYVGYTR